MSNYMDVGQFHKNEQTGKWRFQKLGYAKPDKDGTGYDVYLDALPIPGPYGVRVSIKPQQDRQQKQGGESPSAGAGGGSMDDEIPFAPEVR